MRADFFSTSLPSLNVETTQLTAILSTIRPAAEALAKTPPQTWISVMLTTEALPLPSLEQTPSIMSLPCIFSKGGIGINAISLEVSNKVYLAARTKQKKRVPKKTNSST